MFSLKRFRNALVAVQCGTQGETLDTALFCKNESLLSLRFRPPSSKGFSFFANTKSKPWCSAYAERRCASDLWWGWIDIEVSNSLICPDVRAVKKMMTEIADSAELTRICNDETESPLEPYAEDREKWFIVKQYFLVFFVNKVFGFELQKMRTELVGTIMFSFDRRKNTDLTRSLKLVLSSNYHREASSCLASESWKLLNGLYIMPKLWLSRCNKSAVLWSIIASWLLYDEEWQKW